MDIESPYNVHVWNFPSPSIVPVLLTSFITLIFSSLYRDRKKIESTWNLYNNFTTISKENWCFENKGSNFPLFTLVFFMNIHIWRHFLRNSACAKKSKARWCNDAKTMVRWRNTNGAIEHLFSAILLLHHRLRIIAPSLSHCRTIASSSSPSHHYSIDPNLMVKWYDSKLRGPIRIPLQLVKNAKKPRFFNREGSLSCRTCYDTEPRYIRSHPRDLPLPPPRFIASYVKQRVLRDLIYPDFHGIGMNHLSKWE